LGRLRTLTIVLSLGAWGAATDGAQPDDAALPTAAVARPPSPVPPVKYLEAGARLFNSGQYDLAAKYINAAQAYRDQLTKNERLVLDAYLTEMAKSAPSAAAPAAAPAAQPAPAPAAPSVVMPSPSSQPSSVPMPVSADTPPDDKQKGRFLLQAAREQTRMGNYEAAAKLVSQVRGMNIKWGLFDDTPDKVASALDKAKPKSNDPPAQTAKTKDRPTAKAKLKEARALMAAKRFEDAEAMALDVKSWNLSYGMFDDTPDKVAAAARGASPA